MSKPALAYLTLMLVRDEAVQRELRLNDKQVEQISAAVTQVDHPLWVLRDVPLDKSSGELRRLLGTVLGRMETTFSADQTKRFEEIILQARGVKALASPELAERLKLSDEQVSRIRAALAAMSDATADKGSKSGGAKQPGRKTPRSEPRDIVELLAPEQQTRLAELTGTSFDLAQVRQVGCQAPALRGVDAWINSEPLTWESQRGKVVAIHFWAFGCINCVHNLPHYQAWHGQFPTSKLTIIGMHTPETEQERSADNLRRNVADRAIAYPVAFDASAENWKAWGNNVWPAVYLIDKQGRVRYWRYGELEWQGAGGERFMRSKIQELLAEE